MIATSQKLLLGVMKIFDYRAVEWSGISEYHVVEWAKNYIISRS